MISNGLICGSYTNNTQDVIELRSVLSQDTPAVASGATFQHLLSIVLPLFGV